MNNQDSFRHNSQAQEPFNFLKTVVRVENGQTRSDSDKENDLSNNVTQEFKFDVSKESVKDEIMSKEDSEMWEDFYNEEEFEGLSSDKKFDEYNHLRTDAGSRMLEKVEEEEEDNAEESYATDILENSSKECTSDSKSTEKTEKTNIRKKRKKRLFRKIQTPAPPSRMNRIGGSHPNLGQQNDLTSPHCGRELETMSETGGVEKKLTRRKQVSRPHCAGPAPQGDRLQQKYQELEQLMLKPLASPAVYVQQTRHQMLRLQGLSSHPQSSSSNLSSLPPTGPPAQRDHGNTRGVIQIIDEDTNEAYSIVCNVQDTQTAKKGAFPGRRPMSGQRLKRPQSASNIRPWTADNAGHSNTSSKTNVNNVRSRGRARAGARMTRKFGHDSSNSGGSNKRSDDSGSETRDLDGNDSSIGRARSRSDSKSPSQTIVATDNHLKNSSNPALRQWLKVKDKEFKKQKLEERKKKRKDRLEKQEEEIKKQELLEKGEEKVKEWMSRKRKEAWKQAREDRRKRIEEEKQFLEQQSVTDSLKGKQFIPIKRPEGKYEKQNSEIQSNNDLTASQPKSKFVYKRPVSGRVRLMKLQQDWKDDTKKQEAKKKEMDKFYAVERERKMRVSYDQWLLKKREEDYAKRQALAKERALAKSDPELQNIVPEMARRRIENIKRSKKRVDTGMNSVMDKKINESFGGGDFDEDDESKPGYRLHVVGDKKSLKQRPSSAKAAPTGATLNPKLSKSPRRPQSAHPRVEALMDESQDSNTDDSGFKLPFPPALGVPKYVAAKQEKLFSQKVISDSLDGGACGGDGSGIARVSDSQQDNLEVKDNAKGNSEMDQTEHETAGLSQGPDEQDERDKLSNRIDADEQSFFLTDGNTNGIASQEETENVDECEPAEDISHHGKESKAFSQNGTSKEAKLSEKKTVLNHHEDVCEERKESALGNEENEMENNERLVPPLDIGDDTQEVDDDRFNEANMDIYSTNVDESIYSKSSDKGDVLDSAELKSSIKHVSFSEENIIHEDPLIGIANDEDFFDDYVDQEPYGVEDETDPEQEHIDPTPQLLNDTDNNLDHEILDEIEGYQDEDDEVEDERGNYFDCGTPRDNDEF